MGTLSRVQSRRGNLLLRVRSALVDDTLKLGDSISLNGVCLTVTGLDNAEFEVEASEDTCRKTTIRNWKAGFRVNLERALRLGDRFGGHLVQGHIDGLGKVSRVSYGSGSSHIDITVTPDIHKLLAPRGSIAVDGVSLTLAEKLRDGFQVMVIPHTLEHTTLGELKPGSEVNLETDLIIRWLADQFPDGSAVSATERDLPAAGGFHLED